MSRSPASLALLATLALLVAGCGGGGGSATSSEGCTPAKLPPARSGGATRPPAKPLDPTRRTTLELVTNCGSFTITLDVKGAPRTTASLVSLARAGFYDDTSFHRIVPGFVIQGGDPTQTGTGGPGYRTVDRPAASTAYTKGVAAMAKTASEPPGTAGSQFFVVTADDAGLPPEYAVVGTVTSGLDVVERIGALGNTRGQPSEPVVIRHAIVTIGP